MRKPYGSKAGEAIAKKKDIIIEIIDSDSDTDNGKMLALCGNTSPPKLKTNMQIICLDDDDDDGSGLVHDSEYMKYIASYRMNPLYYLEDNPRNYSPMLLTYNVETQATDKGKGRAVKANKSRGKSSVSKKLKTENVKPGSKSLVRTKETRRKKEDVENKATDKGKSRAVRAMKSRGKSPSVSSVSKKLKTENVKPGSKTKETRVKREDVRRGKESSLTKNKRRVYKKERNTKAAKRLKTEKTSRAVKTEETRVKKGEIRRGRRSNVTPKTTSNAKDSLCHSYRAPKKESEDKSYEYFLAESMRNSITIFEPNRQVTPAKEGCTDPDIIAISNHPFSDGDNCPFEGDKDEKVVDVEEGIEIDGNSLFSRKLMKILRKPYDRDEFLQLYNKASFKRKVTKTRQLRDGRDLEYEVDDQFRDSYLEQHPDFNKKFRRCRREEDTLNLLRGFLFYLEHIANEGAFKPWLYEERVKKGCEDIA